MSLILKFLLLITTLLSITSCVITPQTASEFRLQAATTSKYSGCSCIIQYF